MRVFYEFVGRMVVAFVRRRYGRQLQAAALVTGLIAALGAAAYLASRDDDDDDEA